MHTAPKAASTSWCSTSFFERKAKAFFIEVGAARPDLLSIGALFRKRGWRVIAIEPNPVFCEMHRAKGNEILQYACGTQDEDDVEFSVVHSHSNNQISNESYSSLSIKAGYAALEENMDNLDVEKIRVKLRRLDSIMAAHAPEVERVDCLSIDVEGWELEVLEGFNLSKFRPRVMIIENLLDDENYRTYMTKHGYSLWKTLHPNEVYVRAA